MRNLKYFITGILLALAAGASAADWKLVWSDEFNYHGLPDTNKWDYEEGFVRNHESQYYTRARSENARVEDGHLILECRKEHFTPTNHAPVEYTSASLTTLRKADWQYGRIEVRARIPQGRGVWPAIWTLGTNITQVGWPRCGEIDIMEFVGKEPDVIHGTIHYSKDGKHASNHRSILTERPFDDFHIYNIEWTPQRIDFYFDGLKYQSADISPAIRAEDNAFSSPHYLILNFALGGDWGGPIDDSALPQQFVIDYVRVYQQPAGK
jgi:beta-glucanase (GH16 family)